MVANYYASYSLEYYEVGTVYSFYARKGDKYMSPIDLDVVKKYASKLDSVKEDTDEYPSNSKFSNLIRLCGVVVEKIQGDNQGRKDKIRVMFKLVDENGEIVYGYKLYVVNYSSVETDGWEALPVQTYAGVNSFAVGVDSFALSEVQKDGKKGNVTVDETFNTKGRVTLDGVRVGTIKDNTKAKSSENKKRARVTIDETTGVTLDE